MDSATADPYVRHACGEPACAHREVRPAWVPTWPRPDVGAPATHQFCRRQRSVAAA